MITTVPLLPFPYKAIKGPCKSLYPISSKIVKAFPSLEEELRNMDSLLSAKEYMSASIFMFGFYFSVITFILGTWAYRSEAVEGPEGWATLALVAFSISLALFLYAMIFPKWLFSKKKVELERNLLFATRHIMVQVSAGVPLFDALVSASEQYGNADMDYGEISKEFNKIVKEVRGGKELTEALEESAIRNPSQYYRRVIWQLSNSQKAGTDVGVSLESVVEFLSNEQRIMIRDYGSQLNPLALFYMLMCVIAPSMGLVFMMIASTLVELPLNEGTFGAMIVGLLVMQVMFIGIIKNRRPKVAI
ncbi:type II secretion system F family protein [Candidatus Micrarchaeota archaeon]|nr:type II secretion system F family protein [Candidatus Micrarchaeota archaeon]